MGEKETTRKQSNIGEDHDSSDEEEGVSVYSILVTIIVCSQSSDDYSLILEILSITIGKKIS